MPPKAEKPAPVSVSGLDNILVRQIKRAEQRSKKNVPDPELFAMLAVSQTANLDPGATKHLGRRMALHQRLIANPEITYSPKTTEAIEDFAGWAIEDLKKYRRDLSDLPRAWQQALDGTVRQYGNPDA